MKPNLKRRALPGVLFLCGCAKRPLQPQLGLRHCPASGVAHFVFYNCRPTELCVDGQTQGSFTADAGYNPYQDVDADDSKIDKACKRAAWWKLA
jgi:hypothetical protein